MAIKLNLLKGLEAIAVQGVVRQQRGVLLDDDEAEEYSPIGPTWEQVTHIDETVLPGDRQDLKWLMENTSRVCPYLKLQGECVHYCSKGIPDHVAVEFTPLNPIMMAKQGPVEVAMYCRGEYENCTTFDGTFDPPGARFVDRAAITAEYQVISNKSPEDQPLLNPKSGKSK